MPNPLWMLVFLRARTHGCIQDVLIEEAHEIDEHIAASKDEIA